MYSDTVITMGSLSKSVWGGPRVGWIRATRPVIGRLARLRAVHDLGGNFPAQLAAAELLPRLETLCQDMAADRQARHDHLRVERAQQLPQWQAPPVTGGQTLWARLPHGDGDSFDQTALRHGVAVLPGSGLDASGGSKEFIRIHFLATPDVLVEAVRRLATAWQAYGGGHDRGDPAPAPRSMAV